MADKDTSTEDEVLDTSTDSVETDEDNSAEDETAGEDQDEDEVDAESDEGEDSEDDSDSEEDDSEEDDEENEEEPEFKKAFSQIKGDTPVEYIPNLEEAYRKSSREAKRLAGADKEKQERLDLINQVVAKNPDFQKAIAEVTEEGAIPPTTDPALAMARQNFEKEIAKELEIFMGDHPDLEGDEETMDEFMDNVETVGAAARKKGKYLSPKEAYKKAWGMMDHDDSKDQLANAAKKTASKPKTSTTKKPISTNKPKLTAEEIAVGKKMGLSEKQLLETKEKSKS